MTDTSVPFKGYHERKYTIFPGWMTSKKDGQHHYISALLLFNCYQVHSNDCNVYDSSSMWVRRHEPNVDTYWLYPRYHGNYVESKQWLEEHGMTRRKQCEGEGREAYIGGKAEKDVPYSNDGRYDRKPQQREAWLKGWTDEKAERTNNKGASDEQASGSKTDGS